MDRARIMIVEDESIVAHDIAYRLRDLGYEAGAFARTGEEVMQKALEYRPDLILMDIVLAGPMDGIEAAGTIADALDVPVVYLTAYADDATLSRAKVTDPSGYVLKPVENRQLRIAVELALHKQTIEKVLEENHARIYTHMRGIIEAVAETVETRGPYTPGHHRRIGKLASALAGELGLTSFQVEALELAASVYDLGMVKIPMVILVEGDRLTGFQREMYETYPQAAYATLKKVEFLWPIADIVLQHREHYDGSGFPRGLRGDTILVEARILAVAHALEELTTHRGWRNALALDGALAELSARKGTHYDARVVDALVTLFGEKGFRFE